MARTHMLADRLGTATIVLLCSLGAAVVAVAEDETPDMALLEYLGSWEDSDADWMLQTIWDTASRRHSRCSHGVCKSRPGAGR